MDPSTLRKKATRTESVIESVDANKVALESLLKAYISIGNMLDQIKKNAFYGKPYDLTNWSVNKDSAIQSLNMLHHVNPVEDHEPIDVNTRIFHSIIGMCTESTELAEALKASWKTNELDTINLLEECFDMDWYQFILLDELDTNIDQVWDAGFIKLEKRFPEAFSSIDAINRDTDAERKTLETNLK